MKDRVLVLINRFGIGGVETHVTSIANALREDIDFYIAAFDDGNKEYFLKYFKAALSLDSSKKLISNFEALLNFAKDNNITKIHVHQPGVYWESFLLSNALKIPYYITTHSLIHPAENWKQIIPISHRCWDEIIFKGANGFATVSDRHIPFWENASLALKDKIVVTQNCINESDFTYRPSFNDRFFMAIRLEEEKRRAIDSSIEFIEYLVQKGIKPKATLTIVGDGFLKEEYEKKYKYKKYIIFKGAVAEVSTLISDYDYVIGTGRAALEGVASGKCVLIFGLWGMHGLLTPSNFVKFSKANFNGMNFKESDLKSIANSIAMLTEEKYKKIANSNFNKLKSGFGEETIKREIKELYSCCNSASVLPIERDLILAEAETYIIKEMSEHKKQLSMKDKEIRDKERLVNNILNSKSWKLTRPLRLTVEMAKNIIDLFQNIK